ncbi:hypothetical protein ACLMJK_001440 [Lecanora helva]
MATVDFRGPSSHQRMQRLEHPNRKPVPAATGSHRNNDLRPLSKIVPDIDYSGQKQQNASSYATYSRRGPQPPSNNSPASQQYPIPLNKSRRTPSQSTTSTAVSGTIPTRTPSNVSSVLSRNASTRSGASITPGSYVALMRKQKATVWCDRAQHEDPRLAAQHKAAKIRAAREITGKVPEGRTSTSGSMGSGSGGVRSKIRHHGIPKATGYSNPNMVGGGVPMRLSANEVGDEGSHNINRKPSLNDQRTYTRRSSNDSKWLDVDQRHRNQYSNGGSAQGESPNDDIPELEETPMVEEQQHQKSDYFPPITARKSASSSERENSFGQVGQMEAPKVEEKARKTSDELRRRGSVDERTNTMGYMGQGRLFVANPDLSD